MKMKVIYMFLMIAVCAFANSRNVVGRVIDEKTLSPIEFANVVLLNKADSGFVAGAVTDADGRFSFANLQASGKILKISCIGYQEAFVNLMSDDVGEIQLSAYVGLLNEVVVKASVHKLENAGISANIQASHLKNIGSASDVLRQLPFVYKTGDEFEVFGRGTPLIYINNRLLRNKEELEDIHSVDIKKVTVITNPGAEYDGSVNAVIRIETVKAVGEGWSGSTNANVRFDRKFSHREIQNINYRIKKWDIFGMLRFAEASDLSYQNTSQFVRNDEMLTEVEQSVRERGRYKSLKANIGFNSTFGKESSYGFKYEFTNTPRNESLVDVDAQVFKDGSSFENYLSDSEADLKTKNHYLNGYYSGVVFPWLSVQVDADTYIGETDRVQHVNAFRFDAEERVSTNSKQMYELYAGKLTLKSPFVGGELNYGSECSYTENSQSFFVDEGGEAQGLEENSNVAKQSLLAAFAIYNRSWAKIALDLGLRYEDVAFDYYDKDGRLTDESKHYRNLLPNIGLSYSGDKLQAMLSYRSTIYRPSYYQLRNNIQYNSPYTYESGNPYLKPTYESSLSLLVMWKGFKISSKYSVYKNNILFVPEQYKSDIIILRPQNINQSENASFSVSYSTKVGVWRPTADVGVSKDFLTYASVSQRFNRPICTFQIRNNFSLPKGLLAGLDAVCSTNGNSNLAYVYGSPSVSLYLTKLFFENRLRLNVRGSDIFYTSRKKREIRLGNAGLFQDGDLNSRGLTISVVYSFNAVKSKYKGEQATNELDRL